MRVVIPSLAGELGSLCCGSDVKVIVFYVAKKQAEGDPRPMQERRYEVW